MLRTPFATPFFQDNNFGGNYRRTGSSICRFSPQEASILKKLGHLGREFMMHKVQEVVARPTVLCAWWSGFDNIPVNF